MHPRSVVPGVIGAVASFIGAAAAAVSTTDYAKHLDRNLHGTHCSFIPGLGDATSDNACTVALQSPYSAVLKDRFWGGVPISLFALGAFTFTFALALFLALAREQASKRVRLGYFLITLGPFLASIAMFLVSAIKLGQFCKVCVAVYVASIALFVSGILALVSTRTPFAAVPRAVPPPEPPKSADLDATALDPEPWHQKAATAKPTTAATAKPVMITAPLGSWAAPIGLLAAMGTATALPAAVYAGTLPDYRGRINGCGKLEKPEAPEGVLVKIKTGNPKQKAITFEDPLCPNCKAFHDRLVADGLYDKLDLQVAIFPLDSECNWMLKRSMHPGACTLAKAFLCAEKNSDPRAVLEWSYEHQEELTAAGKAGGPELRNKIKARFPGVDACIDSKEVQARLEEVLRFAIANQIRVSTPQLFLGDTRVCPEDTDIGLSYAIEHLAPEIKR